MDDEYIDKDEKEIIEAYDSVDLTKVSLPTNEEQLNIRNAAANFVKKETKMNIRIDPLELEKIKEIAGREGLKYQSFIKSIIHKYITGQLIEKRNIR